jgi:aspartokinase
MLLATGEMVPIALLAMALQNAWCPAASFTGTQGGIVTDNARTRAHIKQITATRVCKVWGCLRPPAARGQSSCSSLVRRP